MGDSSLESQVELTDIRTMSGGEAEIPWKVPRTNKVPGYWDFDYLGFKPFPLYKSTRYWDEKYAGSFKFSWLACGPWYPIHWGKGDNTMQPSKPLEGLHRKPEVWDSLSDEQKETFDILDMRYLGMPTHALKAVAFHYANRCNKVNQIYVLASSEFQDPRSALRAGRDVTLCAEDTFKFTLKNCRETFTEVARCLEKQPLRLMGACRPEQFAFDKCMANAGQDKQRLGVYEQIIEDEDVPWGARPKNPHNYRVVQVPENKRYDPLSDIHSVPDNDAFRDFLKRKEEVNQS